ncbi:MAG: DNA polymerase III subunit delta' [Actinomycetia bacterium]|nr:DNA polymerase III subunit delta' [Actinomycetes bacterium]
MLADIIGQEDATSLLATTLRTRRLSNAYLFVGPAGLGKLEAARSLAAGFLCDQGGCGSCPTCQRIARDAYPDFQILEPDGVSGYLIDQIRELTHDAALSPHEGSHKFYVLLDSDQLAGAAANALLKTLEEPPAAVTFILIAHSLSALLPTVLSRCQVLRFRPLPTETMIEILTEATGASEADARIALAATGSVLAHARAFLFSPMRRATRGEVLRIVRDLAGYRDREVLAAALTLQASLEGPVAELAARQDAELAVRAELLDKVALRRLEQYNKKKLTAATRRATSEVFSVISGLLRDALAQRNAAAGLVLNVDALDFITRIATCVTPEGARRGQEAIALSRQRLAQNVGVQLILETLLFKVREVLTCQ